MVPRLPPGVCFGDSGGLQLASSTLGITHPPGYAVYASLGYLVTRLPWVDPAYAVTLACLIVGIAGVLLSAALQIQLGVHAAAACAFSLLFAANPRVWSNLQVAEVYLPTLTLLAASACLLVFYERTGRRGCLWLAALCWGLALAARPPVLFTLPGVLAAWGRARRRWERSWRQGLTSFLLAAVSAALPGVYALGYLWVRDTPATRYNYIEQYNEEFGLLPPTSAGPGAKWERVLWLSSARQFAGQMGNSWSGVRSKLRWMGYELSSYRPVTLWILALAALGAVVAFRRSHTGFCMLLGMAAGNVVFLCLYRVHGDAADTLALLLAATVFAGLAVSAVLPARAGRWRGIACLALWASTAAYTMLDASDRRCASAAADATVFLTEVDMATLPPRAILCATWHHATALWYAQKVLTRRDDVRIVNARVSEWQRLTRGTSDRPVFATVRPEPDQHPGATAFRNLWRLDEPPATSP